MRIEVTGRQLEVTGTIQEYVDSKCERLTRYFNGVQQFEVVLESQQHSMEEFLVELRAEVVKHDTFVAKATGADLYKCIDQCVDKMARQLTDYKEKLREH